MCLDTPLGATLSFISAQFEKRDAEEALACLAPDVLWFSPHFAEASRGKERVRALLANDVKDHPSKYLVEFKDMTEVMLTPEAGSVSGRVRAADESSSVECCLSASCVLCEGRFYIAALHMPLPSSVQREMDAAEAQKNMSLLEMLADDMPGGLAVYEFSPSGSRVLYLSDSMHNSIGYTKEEYEALYEDSNGPLCMVLDEDRHIIREQAEAMRKDGSPFNCAFRVRAKDGALHWISLRGSVSERIGDKVIANAFFMDITEQKAVEEKLRMSEETYRLALQHSGNIICRYDIAERSVTMSPETAALFSMPEKVADVPYEPVRLGNISKESVESYVGFYENILRGDKSCGSLFRVMTTGGWKWLKANSTTIFSDEGKPTSAVISFLDVTEEHEKELAYERHIQSRRSDMLGKGTVYFDTDLTANVVENQGGNLPSIVLPECRMTHDETVNFCVNTYVNAEDIERALELLKRETLLDGFNEGVSALSDVWRIDVSDGQPHWMRTNIQLIQDPYSGHVWAYTTLNDVTDEVLASREIEKKAELDGLTGLFNRSATEALIKQKLKHGSGGCVLLIADLDDLKFINDSFGHPQGDRAIKALAETFKSHFRRTDIIGRIGGDEFLIYLEGSISEARRRSLLDTLMSKLSTLSVGERDETGLHASIGAVTGEAGWDSFDDLYHKADRALYHIKRGRKNGYAFYSPDMD